MDTLAAHTVQVRGSFLYSGYGVLECPKAGLSGVPATLGIHAQQSPPLHASPRGRKRPPRKVAQRVRTVVASAPLQLKRWAVPCSAA